MRLQSVKTQCYDPNQCTLRCQKGDPCRRGNGNSLSQASTTRLPGFYFLQGLAKHQLKLFPLEAANRGLNVHANHFVKYYGAFKNYCCWSHCDLCFYCYFRGVQDFLNHEHRVFNSEEFLRTREPADQLFYKKVRSLNTHRHTHTNTEREERTKHCVLIVVCRSQVLDTHIFHSFLRDRLNRKWDAFSRMEQNTRDNAHRYDEGMVAVGVTRQRCVEAQRNQCSRSSQTHLVALALECGSSTVEAHLDSEPKSDFFFFFFYQIPI